MKLSTLLLLPELTSTPVLPPEEIKLDILITRSI